MSEEYAMTPEVQSRYESRLRELNTKIVDEKTMLFRRKNDGSIETRIVKGRDVQPRTLGDGWVDSAAKCVSDEIYKLALDYPERRAGELRRMLAEKDKGLAEDIAKAAASSEDREALEARYSDIYGRSPHSAMKLDTLREKVAEGEARGTEQP